MAHKDVVRALDALLRKRLSAHTRFRYYIRSSVLASHTVLEELSQMGCVARKKLCAKKFTTEFYFPKWVFGDRKIGRAVSLSIVLTVSPW